MASVEIYNTTKVGIDLEAVGNFARRVLESTRDYKDSEVSISLVGDKKIQSLNEKWRGKRTPTDVLSFPIDSPGDPGPFLLGDIVVGARQALSDAREEGVPLDDKLRELILHSLLHLMGFDHETGPEDARRMENRRKRILKKLRCEHTVTRSESET